MHQGKKVRRKDTELLAPLSYKRYSEQLEEYSIKKFILQVIFILNKIVACLFIVFFHPGLCYLKTVSNAVHLRTKNCAVPRMFPIKIKENN
jgi:hypothetical protein